MARYKFIDRNPRLIAVSLDAQLLPGTFEHALDYLIDHEMDLSRFDARYRNDDVGASGYPPRAVEDYPVLYILSASSARVGQNSCESGAF